MLIKKLQIEETFFKKIYNKKIKMIWINKKLMKNKKYSKTKKCHSLSLFIIKWKTTLSYISPFIPWLGRYPWINYYPFGNNYERVLYVLNYVHLNHIMEI